MTATSSLEQIFVVYPELSKNALSILDRRYLARDTGGNIIEDAEELFERVARNISEAETLYYFHTEEYRAYVERQFYDLLRSLDFLPNTPTLINAGRRLQQLAACFVLPVYDSLEDIFEAVKQTALIHKSGGGTGFNFSNLRPSDDIVGSTGGIASGPVSFISAFDAATDVVKQGSVRRGANMGVLNVTHPDILEFISIKNTTDKLQNFNISVAVTDDFMQRAIDGDNYYLINPRNDEIVGELNAMEVFNLIVEAAWNCADPGLIFWDSINRDHPNPLSGPIESVNPCSEQVLEAFGSCTLGSINLANMVMCDDVTMEYKIDWDRLLKAIHLSVRFLDNVLDMNAYPIPQIRETSRKFRRIGLGVMGWSDLLFKLRIRYDSESALSLAEEVMGFIQGQAHVASENLSEERGVYPAWAVSLYERPMRHTSPITIAPTGTISRIAGCSSGIEPAFSLVYESTIMDGTKLVDINSSFALWLESANLTPEQITQIYEQGSLEDVAGIPDNVSDIFRISHQIDPEWHIRMQAAFQKYTDNSISKTINMPHDSTIEEVRAAYLLAWRLGCKGITVYRDGSKQTQVLTRGTNTYEESDICPECDFRLVFEEGCKICYNCNWSACSVS